jgi:transglutaminase-like putative cysteine protease
MKIRAGYDIAFDLPQATALVFMLTVHPSRTADLLSKHDIRFSKPVKSHTYRDIFDNVCTRVVPGGRLELFCDVLVRDTGRPDEVNPRAEQIAVENLPDDALQFLLGSRYCETDTLSELAWSLFGKTRPGWERVQAICDYVHDQIAFSHQHARSDRTAFGAHREKMGVCRDFAHLAVTLCRCMNIPARYCTGYLGDIGVPRDPAPIDFSAWFEAFLGGRWYTFDARHNVPRIGRILIARGRDATDVAISTSFGPAKLTKFTVVADEAKVPANLATGRLRGLVQLVRSGADVAAG